MYKHGFYSSNAKSSEKVFNQLNCSVQQSLRWKWAINNTKRIKETTRSEKVQKILSKFLAKTCIYANSGLSFFRQKLKKLKIGIWFVFEGCNFFLIYCKTYSKTKLIFSYAIAKMQNFIVQNLLNHCQKVPSFLFWSAIPYLNTLFFWFSWSTYLQKIDFFMIKIKSKKFIFF